MNPTRGRARDPAIDERVLAAASRQLAASGYEALSVAAVAEEAGTTRQAIYRRWPGKAELAAAAMDELATGSTESTSTTTATAAETTGRTTGVTTRATKAGTNAGKTAAASTDPFHDLVVELADFRRAIARPGRLSLVGTMLQDSVEPDVRARYRLQVIAPRRRRLRSILERARELGLVDADADLEIAVTMATGSWYARALAGDTPPRSWPQRTATLVWRSVGGEPSAVRPRRGRT